MPGPETLVVLAFAAYRATRIFTKDSITSDLRARLYAWAWNDDHGQAADPIARSPMRTYVYEGLTCSFCLGVWVSLALYLLWRHAPDARGLIVVLAVAGGQALLASRTDA